MRNLRIRQPNSARGPLVRFRDDTNSYKDSIVVIDNAESLSSVTQSIRQGAIGICAKSGSYASHGSIAAKELGIVIVFDNNLSKSIIGEVVTIYSDGRLVVDGRVQTDVIDLTFPDVSIPISINLGFPEVIQLQPEITKLIDLLGFVRLEFVLIDLLKNRHPLSL